MSVIESAQDSLRNANRRVVIYGPFGSGKTTLAISASRFAGDTLPVYGEKKEPIECKDTLVIQGDNEGVLGAVDAGLVPRYVLDMTDVKDWQGYTAKLVKGLRELQKPLTDGTIRVVVIDLGWPAKLIDKSIDPKEQRDWKLVAKEGMVLFTALSGLKGVTVVAVAQVKATNTMAKEGVEAVNVKQARAIGGETSTFTIDLPKGIASLWTSMASLILAREAKRVKAPDGSTARTFRTHTQSSPKFEAKSRAGSRLAPTEDGHHTLHALLRKAYGEAH